MATPRAAAEASRLTSALANSSGPRFFTKTTTAAATTFSTLRRSSTNNNDGECVMALIENRASEVGVAFCQLSSLAIVITQYGDSVAFAKTLSFVSARNPVEVLVSETTVGGKFVQSMLRHLNGITFTGVPRRFFDEAQGAHRLLQLMSTDEACVEVSNTDRYLCLAAANALIEFMEMTYNYILTPHTVRVKYLALENYMEVSRLAARALNLIPCGAVACAKQLAREAPVSTDGGSEVGAARGGNGRAARKTLFRPSRETRSATPFLPLVDSLNHTTTAMGRRLLRSTLLQPLRDRVSIELRYDAVEWLRSDDDALAAIRKSLRPMGSDDMERVVSIFSHTPKQVTLKTMQQSIEAVVKLWQLLSAATRLTDTLRKLLSVCTEVLDADGPEKRTVESDDTDASDNDNVRSCVRISGCNASYGGNGPVEQCRSETHPWSEDESGLRGSVPTSAPSDPLSESRVFAGRCDGLPTLLCKLLDTLSVCRMEEICCEISVYLDESVVQATGGFAPSSTLVRQKRQRAGGAALQVQQCFVVKPNLSGTLDAARHQYSYAVEAMIAHTDELKQRHGVGSLRVMYDGARGYHLSYDARHECNACDAVFLQKYSGGEHYALYRNECATALEEGEHVRNAVDSEWGEGLSRQLLFPTSSMPQSDTHERFGGTCNDRGVIKHQVRGRRVTCTTREMLCLRRTADDAVAEILQTQDGLVRCLIDYLRQRLGKLQAVCDSVAMLDLLVAFGTYSRLHDCTRPRLLQPGGPLEVNGTHFVEARHPSGSSMANTVRWDDGVSVLLVTGPNAAGKTTLLRQIGQLVALAQSGCFIPAREAALQPCDRLIAHMLCDDQEEATISAFAKEMRELSYLCTHVTQESLVLVDELGRRTSAREGNAIAWATVEFLVETRCRAIFVTHFGRLARLEEHTSGAVKNFHLAVGQSNDLPERQPASAPGSAVDGSVATRGTLALRFDYRLLPGPSVVDRYGLRLAAHVGFFGPALQLAWELLPFMENMELPQKNKKTDIQCALIGEENSVEGEQQ
ncbi:MutS domain [Trypanosoma vivax]|uniref:Putative mismatch repair protein n=1 Tax=Trypanosoma vivax (strain Y486) TaxID=1055687 RepID=G0U5C3_TRYVY|nr:putative mismatch repair protein [Trypanosoma vivax]KAH8618494.1 MutS domain [Trypanosoma vivax]CCC51071.1 putative mismatch repair protein [Trypanosoma vivax Y486]